MALPCPTRGWWPVLIKGDLQIMFMVFNITKPFVLYDISRLHTYISRTTVPYIYSTVVLTAF